MADTEKKEKKPKEKKEKKEKPKKAPVKEPKEVEKKVVEKRPRKHRFYKRAGRLYVTGIFTGYKRSQRNQDPNFALITIKGCRTKQDAQFYVGKKCVYAYRAPKGKAVSGRPKGKRVHIRAIWGKVTRIHGNSGAVRAKFKRNLPGYAMGRRIRVMLYPSHI